MDMRVCIRQGSLEKQNGEGKGETDFKQLVHTVDTGKFASPGNLAPHPESKQKQKGGALQAVPNWLGNQASTAREDRCPPPSKARCSRRKSLNSACSRPVRVIG